MLTYILQDVGMETEVAGSIPTMVESMLVDDPMF